MSTKYLITTLTEEQLETVRSSACDILAEYPKSVLGRCDFEVAESLKAAGLELSEMPTLAVNLSGRSFAMADAMQFGTAPEDSTRDAYFVAQMIGPSIGVWLTELQELGVEVVGGLQAYTQILKMRPDRLDAVRTLGWIESIAPYQPIMKLSPQLMRTAQRTIGPAEFAAPLSFGAGDEAMPVEISTFPDEPIDPILAVIKEADDKLISNSATSAKAIVKRSTIAQLVNRVDVQIVQPFQFPSFENDVAREVLQIPPENRFPLGVFDGGDQIVAVCDSGLDTGDLAAMHPDLRGRVNAIQSYPTDFDSGLAIYINGPVNTDDGPADGFSGHGTHVAGSVAGDGSAARTAGSFVVPIGAAPGARLYFQSIEQTVDWKSEAQLIAEGIPKPTPDWPPRSIGLYGIPSDLLQLFADAYEAGARIHTNSWGASVDGVYNSNSRAVDLAMSQMRDLLVLFAAGNSGQDENFDGQIDSDSIGAPGTAKNCITVGASENRRPANSTPEPGENTTWPQLRPPRFSQMAAAGHVSDDPDGMACFSSRGPVDGGRTKPEAVAPGTNILSVRSSLLGADPLWGDVIPASDPLNGHYCWSGGTSMSTPLVAGMAAVIRQFLIERYGHYEDGVKPSGALLKACLLNGAIRIEGQFIGEIPNGTNNVTGFGRVDTASILDTIGFLDDPADAVETGDIRSIHTTIIDPNRPFRVTMCWTDPPSPGAGQLQNNLYLQVQTPSGRVLDGDVTPFPTVTNNSQQIEVQSPEAGSYTIRVRGVNVVQQANGATTSANPSQDFALVFSNAAPLSALTS